MNILYNYNRILCEEGLRAMKTKRLVSAVTAFVMGISLLPTFAFTAYADDDVYTCDFTQLVKDGADTTYGTSTDIYELDEYTTAYLTYEGTYVDASGVVHLTGSGSNKKDGQYVNGSYIEFTAPKDGTVSFTINYANYFVDSAYKSYSSASVELTEGQKIQIGSRASDKSTVSVLSFVPAAEATPTPTVDPDATTTPSDEPDREVLYSEDFESYSTGDNGGWTSPAGTMSIKTDSTSGIGQYQTVVSGKSGTCRSGYVEISSVTDNFVFECDFKSTSNVNVSDLELLETKNSVYANHGRYSNAKYAFTMARPKSSNLYVINNATDDSGLTLDRYTQPAVTTAEISDNPWLHIKVIGNYDTHTAIAYITSLDKQTVYYHGMTDMSPDISSWKCIHLLSPSSGADTCIDNIKVSKALESDLSEVFYTATIDDGISEFSQYVYSGESVVNIPDMSVYGEYFLGWDVNGTLKTTAELATFPITENATITAKISSDYIENLASVEFNSFPSANELVMGADGDTYADNEISLTILGERGTSLVSNPDSRVEDYAIEWSFDGFRTMDGNSTGESGSFPGTQLYCDSYGRVTVDKTAQTAVNFELKNTSANYYGMVTAKVTYNGKSITVSKPLVLLADTDSSALLPKPGYVADYGKYEDTLVGYMASQNDVLLGGWSRAGSDGSYIELKSEGDMKYLRLSRALTGNSSYIYNEIGNITAQTVFKQDVRFGIDGYIEYGTGKDVTSFTSSAFTVGMSSSKLKLNGTEVCDASSDTWYHIEVCADPTSKLCYMSVYNYGADGDYSDETPIATSDIMSFNDGYTSGNYYRITVSKNRGSIDINNVNITAPSIDEESVNVTVPDSVTIPETGTESAEISVNANTADGNTAIGLASWEIADEFAEGVAIESSGNQSAVLTVSDSASSGYLPIKVTINGYSVTKTVKLVGTKDNVSFVTAPTGAKIPDSGTKEYKYIAEVIDGNAETVAGREITYKLYDANNENELTATGVTLSEDGVLTVASSAEPQTVFVKAVSSDSSGNEISKTVKVSVYNNKFAFGTAVSGYTTVTAADEYTANRGYGITGTATDGDGKITGSDFGFNAELEKGNVYTITVTYSGTIKCERIDSYLTGFERTKESLTEDTYSVAVFGDDIMDIKFSGTGEISSLVIEKTERESNSKPAWWTIGDSTIQQNGSWAYTIASSSTSDFSKYPALDGVISTFYNSGRAGRQHRSYYSEGLMNNLLCRLKPGDVVSISGMGTNDSSSDKEDFKRYNNQYIDAIEDMGGYVILGSYTPSGNYSSTEGKVYDADNILFKGKRTNSYETAIREVYAERIASGDEKIIGFIDIGQISDNLMTNDVRAEYNNAADAGKSISEARAAAETKATEMMAWWKDYNHYYSTFSNYILPEITTRAAQLISGEEQSALPEITELKEIDPSITPTPTEAPTETPTETPTEAPTETPITDNTIEVISKSVDGEKISIKINSGFSGAAVAAMYNADGELNEIFIETDNTAVKEFEFDQPSDVSGYVIKLMNWDSIATMKPYGEAIVINVSEISDTSSIEITSSDEYIDVTALEMYDNSTYRIYSSDGYTDVTAENGKVHNTTGGEVTVVPVYRFEFTSTDSSTDEHINGYVKVTQGSYSEEKGYGLTSDSYSINENGCKPDSGKPIKVDVPNGFYDFTVYRKGGARADLYNNGVQIANNTTSASPQNRSTGTALMSAPAMMVTDNINLTFGNLSGSNERIASVEIVRVPDKYRKSVVWVAGDSESADYYAIDANGDDLDNEKIMITGFGSQLGKFLSDDYAVANYGQPSATVKTWYNECFESVNTLIQKGDTILIDFGINEVASSSNSIGIDEMKQYMQTIIGAAKAKGVTPVIMSPIYNGKYQHKAYFTYSTASKDNAMYDFAEEMGVECIDLNKYTQLYVSEAITATGDESWRANNYHVADNLHLTQHSALLTASFIAAELKSMGYATNDYAYTYKDISDIADGNIRGTESGVTRIYSVAEAEKFILANTDPEPISVMEWDFETDTTATEGDNVPVLSGNVAYNETNQNIKFDANSTTSGTLAINLNPEIQNNVTVGFDLNVGALGGQKFAYAITDNEGNNLVSCIFERYSGTGTLTVGNTVIATDGEFVGAIQKTNGDGMSASTTAFSNEIDFDSNTVTVTIGSTTLTGTLSGAETKTVAGIEFTGSRSKAADRSIYLDNISIKEYKMSGISLGETAFSAFESGVYEADGNSMNYRYYIPNGTEEKLPVVIFLHGETRKGTDNESHMYNAKNLFDEIIENEAETPCILIAPQCPATSSWTENHAYVDTFVQTLTESFAIDTDKIYLAGYGEGADGCYKLASLGGYAAMIAISGSGDSSNASAIAETNAGVMIMNGSTDENAVSAKAMASALVEAGAKNTEYVEFYGEGSNILETSATKDGVLDWLFKNSITSNAQAEQKTVDLAIFMGQSNMAGRGSYASATPVAVGHGYEFRSVTQPDMLFNITGPFGKLENNSAVNDNSGSGSDRRSGDMVSSVMAGYYNETGVPIVGVQCSRGGTNTGYWLGSTVVAEAQARLTAAKTYLENNGYTIGHIFMVWCQGESDGDKLYSGSQSVATYKSNTLAIFDYMKEVGVTDMFIVQTGHYNGSDDEEASHEAAYVSINAAQAELSDENENVYTVGSLLDYKDNMIDSYHFNQDAYNAVGTTAGKNIADIYSE